MENFLSLVRDAQQVGIIKKAEPATLLNKDEIAGLKLCEELKNTQFWCGDNKLHKKDPDYQHTAHCCFTHIVGLPRHAATKEEMPLTPYQAELASTVLEGRKNFGNTVQQMRKALKLHIKKGRQMGFTEIILRIIQYLCFFRYAGSNVAIIAGTKGALARKDLRRFARLFKSIPSVIKMWIRVGRTKNTEFGISQNTLELVNGTIIEAFSATEEAITGDTNYKCIFMDEAAKWTKVDDLPVFNSIMPIVRTNGADLFLVSTPKGPLKTFYKIDKDHDESDFMFVVYDITHTIGNLNTKEEVDNLLVTTSAEDPDQEYMCQYKSGSESIFGMVSVEDQQGKTEWLVDDDEDDGYVEDRSDDEIIHYAA